MVNETANDEVVNEELTNYTRWYEKLAPSDYPGIKEIVWEMLRNMSRDFVAIGYYLKWFRENQTFREDGYSDIWEFAEGVFGLSRSTTSRWMSMNDKFSKDGNSPILAEEYRLFGKSQLQEMLYLDDRQMEEVTPDMTVKEIRNLKKEPEEEPVSILGYPLRVYPEDSLIATPGCGKQDCFSCHRDGCELRQEGCYCVEAPMGNPFPCTTLNVVENLRAEIGNRCQFVNEDLAYHRPGDGQPVPCCKKCNNPCGYECNRSVQSRYKMEKVQRGKMCDVAQESVLEPATEEQIPRQMSVEDYPEFLPEEKPNANHSIDIDNDIDDADNDIDNADNGIKDVNNDIDSDAYKAVDKQDKPVIDAEYKEVAADNTEVERMCCQKAADLDRLTFSQIAIRDYLDEEERTLDEYEKVNAEDGGLPLNLMMRQRMLVKALRLLLENESKQDEVEDAEETDETKQIQPELPVLKNNEQRKKWLEDYQSWGLWYRDENIDVNYYKYDFSDGSRLVVAEYPQREGYWSREPRDEYYFHFLEKNKKKYASINKVYDEKFKSQTDSETYLVEFLKSLQKGEKK